MTKAQKVFSMVVVGLLLASVGAAVYFYRELSAIKQNPQQVAQENVDKLLGEVSKIMVLPDGETPTVATVADPEKIKNQPFFATAEVGDQVLIYTNARQAILYRPSIQKIIKVAPLVIGNEANQPQ